MPVDARDMPWPEFAQAIAATANEPTAAPKTATPEEQKKHLIAWSPHALTTPRRALENVALVSALVIDVDQGPPPEVVIERAQAFGLAALVYDSPTATPEHPKYRVVCPVTAPIAPADCRETRLRFAAALGLAPDCGVKGAIDASKLFFAGRLWGTPERRAWIIEGQLVDTSALPPCPSAEWHTAPTAPVRAAHLGELPPANAGIAKALGDWRAHQGRKWLVCGAVGGMMRKLGYSAAACEAEIRAWLPADEPTVDVEAGVAWALGAWAKDAADVSGRAELARLVGDEHAMVIAEAARRATPWGRAEVAARPPFAEWAHPVTGGEPPADPLGTRLTFDTPDEPISYVVEALRLAPSRGKVSMFGGLAGAGKGPLFDYVHVCIALGVPLFGAWPVVQSEVLIADFEGARLTKHRMHRITRALGFEPKRLDERLDLRDCSGVDAMGEAFYKALSNHSAPVIGIDSYTSAMLRYDIDQNKNEFARLGQCLGSLGRCVSCVTHARKPGGGAEKWDPPTLADISGSGALGALAQTGVSIWKPDPENSSRIAVGCMRAPETSFATFEVVFKDLPDGSLGLELVTAEQRERQAADRASDETTQRVQRVLEFMRRNPEPHAIGKDFTVADVRGKGISGNDLSGVLGMLSDAGFIVRQPGKPTRYQIRHVQDTRAVRVVAGKVVPIGPNQPQ